MALKLVKRGKIYYVRGTYKGAEIYASTKCDRKDAAEDFKRGLERDLDKELSNAGKKTLGEAVEAYLKSGGEERWIAPIVKRYGRTVLDDIDQEWMDVKSREMYPTQSDASVVRWFYTPVCTVLNFSADRKWTHYIKIKKPKFTNPPTEWADLPWFEKLWAECSPQLLAFTTLLPYSGCRCGEGLNLTVEDLDLPNKSAYVRETKTGVPRTIHLTDLTIERLTAILPPSGKIFSWSSHQAVNWAVRRACKRAGIKFLSTHKLGSHTYATWMRRDAKLDIRGLIGTGRWTTAASVVRYTHTVRADEAKKADLLPVPKPCKKRAGSL